MRNGRPGMGLVHKCLMVSTSSVNLQLAMDEPDPDSRLISLDFSIRALDHEVKPKTNVMIAAGFPYSQRLTSEKCDK